MKIEYALFTLWKASIDCEDVQEELMKRSFIDSALKIVQEHSNNINLIAFSLAIIRRLASNPKFKEDIAKNFLYTIMTFVRIFSET